MKLKILKDGLKPPIKSHLPDVGFDLFIPETFYIEPFETKTIGLGLAVAIPEGFAGMLVPRSSIAAKGLIIQTAIIDPDYTGEIHLIITNCSKQQVQIEEGQRVCSLIMINTLNAYIELVPEITYSVRGTNGLGSSGK